MKRIVNWIREPIEGPFPNFDRSAMVFAKGLYLSSVLTKFYLTLPFRKRDRGGHGPFIVIRTFAGPSLSYSFIKTLHSLFNRIQKKNESNRVLKIHVPKLGYKYYCRLDKGDFTPNREEQILTVFKPLSGEVVVDVGAHVGRYAIVAGIKVEKGKVIAIEPDPSNFAVLCSNLKLNNLDNVLPLNIAAYSSDSRIKLYEPDSAHSIYNTTVPARAQGVDKFHEVNARTLDSVLVECNIESINWLKIDVEGAELEVLKGSIQTLSRSPRLKILVEVHDICDKNHYRNIEEFLGSYGFRPMFQQIYDGSRERHVLFTNGDMDS